jgi:hypothetical protein
MESTKGEIIMKNAKAMRRKARQILQKYKYFVQDSEDESENSPEWEDTELQETERSIIPRRKRLDWDDD